MSKEVTLEELANSAKRKPNVIQSGNINNAKPVSIDQMSKELRTRAGLDPVKQEEVKQPELVTNAFNALDNELAARKKFIAEDVMPVVMENAREIAMENELKEAEENKVANEESALNDDEDFDIDSIDLGDPADEVSDPVDDYDIEREYATDFKEPVETISDESQSITTSEPVKVEEAPKITTEPMTESVEEDDTLDQFLNDLNSEDSDDDDIDIEEEPEEIRARFKESLSDVKITKDAYDLSKFTISRKPVSIVSVLNEANHNRVSNIKRADWPLYYSDKCVTFTECSGIELDTLRTTITNSNNINGVLASLRFVYSHIADAKKPKFEEWTKLIRTEDIESLYFGIYKACYGDCNYVTRTCEGKNCKKTSLIRTDIAEMVKFDNDEVKAKFEEIYNKDTTTETKRVKSNLFQISDSIVISYSNPTLYSTFIQYSTLKPAVIDKYSDTLNTMAYIDEFFVIDKATNELSPIEIKKFPGNLNKTVLAKLKAYTEIIKTLTADQYNVLIAKLNSIIKEPVVKYTYPETICPECGAVIGASDIDSVLNLLFTRAQLVGVVTL